MARGSLVKQFERADFLQNMDKTVFLQTTRLTENQQGVLKTLGGLVRDEAHGHIVSVPGEEYFSVNDYLGKIDVEILGCRSEWISLEDLFMQYVQEQES